MQLRVMTYNIHKGVGMDRRYNLSRIVAAIGYYLPDVVLLQEVISPGTASADMRQVDILGNWLGYRHRAYYPHVNRGKAGHWGNAILSRHPIARTEHIDLSIPLKIKRGALHARIRVRTHSGKMRTINIYNLHLGLSSIERKLQLKRFLKSHPFAHFHARTPVIVGGDLNDFWGTLGRKILSPAGFRGPAKTVRTFPSFAPLRALDGLYVRGDLRLGHLHSAHIQVARKASDHLPLIADLFLTN